MPIYGNEEYLRVMRRLPKYIERDIFDIPFIEKDEIDISDLNNGKWLITMKNLSTKDTRSESKIVHSFSFDTILRREYNDMLRYLQKTANYHYVSSFDFTMEKSMDYPLILNAIYANRWSGAFMQEYGKKVIPTVGWIGEKYIDICLAGLRDGSVFLISTLGCCNEDSKYDFLYGYNQMRNRYPRSRIINIGNKIEGMDDDVCYISYEESFGSWNRKNDFWQPAFLNWDGTVSKWGGDLYVI